MNSNTLCRNYFILGKKKKKDTWNSVKIFRKEIEKKKEKNVSWKFSTVIFLINLFIKDFIK